MWFSWLPWHRTFVFWDCNAAGSNHNNAPRAHIAQLVEENKMTIFQGLLFLFFGVGLLLVNYRALTSGWLPFDAARRPCRLGDAKRDQQRFVHDWFYDLADS